MKRHALLDRCRDHVVARLALRAPVNDLAALSGAVAVAADAFLAAAKVIEAERAPMVQEVSDELCAAGPLQQLLDDSSITEIMVNRFDDVWIERDGRLQHTDVICRDDAQLRSIIDRLSAASGRRIDHGSPLLDCRLADGSRLNAVLPPVAVNGITMTVRRFGARRLDFADLIAGGAMSGEVAAFLHAAVLGRASILISGATGAGKTTLMGALAGLAGPDERLVTIEEVAELQVPHPHVVAQECRPAGGELTDAITLRDLVRNSMRMRPDRLLVGEVRGPEAAEMVMALNTGHAGSMATIHANSAMESIDRLESMLALAWPSLDLAVLRRWIGLGIDLIVHCARDAGGRRSVTSVCAVDLDAATLRLIPLFEERGDRYRRGGEVPSRCLERMAAHGVRFPLDIFADAA